MATRRQRAEMLRERIQRGPAGIFENFDITGQPLSSVERERRYKLWIESWILPELNELIPALNRTKV